MWAIGVPVGFITSFIIMFFTLSNWFVKSLLSKLGKKSKHRKIKILAKSQSIIDSKSS